MIIDARFVILWDFEFKKNGRGKSNFRKIWAIIHWLRGYTCQDLENLFFLILFS